MPQHSMFPTDPRLIGFQLELLDRTPDLVDGFDLTLRTRSDRSDWQTRWSGRYTGVMTDLLPGSTEDLVAAWLFGEGTADVLRSAQSNHRVARMHEKRHALRG